MAENNAKDSVSVGAPERAIRQWRVGTVSMGLILVALGVALLVSRVNETLTLSALLKFWPMVLIILGLEMVLLNTLTLAKKIRIQFTYDLLSIFLVLLLLFVSAGLIALESAGVMHIAQRFLQSSEYYAETEKILYTVDDSLKALALDIDEGRTNLRTYVGSQVKVLVVYNGYFSCAEEANQYAEDQYIRSERAGDTLLIQVYPPSDGYHPNNHVRQEVTVLIPDNLDVEVNQRTGNLNVSLHSLKSNWVVSGQSLYSPMEVTLDGVTHGKVKVELSNNGSLIGNVLWDSEIKHDSPELVEAEKVWGEGNYTLLLQSSGTIEVNTR